MHNERCASVNARHDSYSIFSVMNHALLCKHVTKRMPLCDETNAFFCDETNALLRNLIASSENKKIKMIMKCLERREDHSSNSQTTIINYKNSQYLQLLTIFGFPGQYSHFRVHIRIASIKQK